MSLMKKNYFRAGRENCKVPGKGKGRLQTRDMRSKKQNKERHVIVERFSVCKEVSGSYIGYEELHLKLSRDQRLVLCVSYIVPNLRDCITVQIAYDPMYIGHRLCHLSEAECSIVVAETFSLNFDSLRRVESQQRDTIRCSLRKRVKVRNLPQT